MALICIILVTNDIELSCSSGLFVCLLLCSICVNLLKSAGLVKPACGHRTKFQTYVLRHPGDRGAVRLSEVTPKLNKATNQVDEMTSKARASQLLRNQLENIIVKHNRRQTTH